MHITVCVVSATHVPLLQLSFGVHALLSALHAAPSLYGYVHVPLLHAPADL
jgi:hypothetical protein